VNKNVLGIVGILGISLIVVIVYFSLFNYKHIEDTNGAVTNLETIHLSDKDVTNRIRYLESFSGHTYSGSQSGVKGKFDEQDYDFMKYKTKKFSGVKVVHATKVKNHMKLVLEIESELKSGNLEIIVVGPNHELIEQVEINSKKQIVINSTIEGDYLIIIGGESAQYRLEIKRYILI
jgi:hypothetical protein